jgi:ABC-type polysaccharide/polyol phosphate export permease
VLLVALYIAPVIYPLAQAKRLQNILLVNPVTGPLQLTRFAIFGDAERLGASLLITAAWIVALTIITLLAYRRHERVAVDRL